MFSLKNVGMSILAFGAFTCQWGYAANIIVDGSFESANLTTSSKGILSGALPGSPSWTVSSDTSADFGVNIIDNITKYFGQAIPADPLLVGSNDLAGAHAAYFFNDNGTVTLSQQLSLSSGVTYQAGWDLLAAFTGEGNAGNPTLSIMIGTTALGSFDVSKLPIPTSATDATAWTNVNYNFTVPTTGAYDLSFIFAAPGKVAKDVVVDRVYVERADQTGAVPEPSYFLGIGAILAACCIFRRRPLDNARR